MWSRSNSKQDGRNILYNTIIIGAGPVGSYLADKLGQLGHSVLVLDKKSGPGQDVCCTGIVSKECLDLLPAGIDLPRKPISSATFVAPSGKSLKLSRPDVVAYVVDRVVMEQVLSERARSDNVCYLFDRAVGDVELTATCVKVTANCGGRKTTFEAETAVITAGFGSPLPARLGLGKINRYITGAQAEVGISDLRDIEIYFDRKLGPGGFSWLVPTGPDRGLVGQLSYRQPKQNFRKLLSALKTRRKILTTEVKPDYRLIPLKPLPKTCGNRLLVIGEAAGQVKPVTGGGLYYGFLCADIAADTLHQAFLAGDFSEHQLAAYERRWRALLGKELTVGFWVHRLYRLVGNSQIEAVHNLISRNGMPRFISEMEEFPFDWHGRLIGKTLKHLVVSIPSLAIKPLIKREADADKQKLG